MITGSFLKLKRQTITKATEITFKHLPVVHYFNALFLFWIMYENVSKQGLILCYKCQIMDFFRGYTAVEEGPNPLFTLLIG